MVGEVPWPSTARRRSPTPLHGTGMSFRLRVPGWAAFLVAFAALTGAQAAPRPQPYCIRGVALDRTGERKATLILRDGAIAAVLDEAAPVPPGTRVIEGAGLICLPAFLDAY